MTKTWFITGSSKGFGRIWAEAALQRGDQVAATARQVESLRELKEHYGEHVLTLALEVLAGASEFGTRVDLDIEWPVYLREAYRAWQPKEPSPIVKKMLEARQAST